MIKISLNNDEISLTQGDTIEALLRQASMEGADHIAIAVNDTVIRRPEWPSHRLHDNDQVLMIAPIQGG